MELRQKAQNDGAYHDYWYSLGCPTDDEELLEQFYNPVIVNVWHTIITVALPKLPEENEEKREKVFQVLQNLRDLDRYKYLRDKPIHFSLEFYSIDKKLKYIKDNFHAHILVKGKYDKFDRKRIIRDFAKKFKVEANFVDVKYNSCPELYSTRVEYLKGNKKKEKDLAIEKDKVERKELGIEDYYSLNL